MNKLMYEVSKEELLLVPSPELTRTYKPVENQRLIELTLESIEKSGFKVEKEYYTAAQNGNQSNGRYTINNVADQEMQLQIGWQNSYNKSLSLKYAIGVQVFICTNGACRGDMGNFKKKHMGKIQEFVPATVVEYIKQAEDTFQLMQRDRDRMKEIELTKRTTSELLGRMFIEEALITSTQLNIIKKELETPTFDYKAKDSLWELYNYTTYSLKESHPANWFSDHINLHNFITSEFIN
jgi:hypothetical protein